MKLEKRTQFKFRFKSRAFKNFTKTLIDVGLKFNSRQYSDYVISYKICIGI